jgi:DNA-binding transcriptional MerR regulator/effector-binding domain-containing protein
LAARLSIGEFAIMTRLSRKALRIYHEQGLLEPAQVDASSGYRYYDTSQVQTAQVIRHFRGLAMPVPEIRAVLAAPDLAARNELLAAHLRRMEDQLAATHATVTALRDLLQQDSPPIEVEFRAVPATRALAISERVAIASIAPWWNTAVRELHDTLGAAPTAGPLGGLYAPELFADEEGAATVYLPTESTVDAHGRARLVYIPAADLAVTVHSGSESNSERTYAALGRYVTEHGLAADGPVRENYLVSGLDTTDDQQHRTEICWPINRPG